MRGDQRRSGVARSGLPAPRGRDRPVNPHDKRTSIIPAHGTDSFPPGRADPPDEPKTVGLTPSEVDEAPGRPGTHTPRSIWVALPGQTPFTDRAVSRQRAGDRPHVAIAGRHHRDRHSNGGNDDNREQQRHHRAGKTGQGDRARSDRDIQRRQHQPWRSNHPEQRQAHDRSHLRDKPNASPCPPDSMPLGAGTTTTNLLMRLSPTKCRADRDCSGTARSSN